MEAGVRSIGTEYTRRGHLLMAGYLFFGSDRLQLGWSRETTLAETPTVPSVGVELVTLR